MSIADKLITIAENVQKTYDAGYNRGLAQGGYIDGYTTGYVDGTLPLYHATQISFINAAFPENTDLVVRFKSLSSAYALFMRTTGLKSVKVIHEDPKNIDMTQWFREAASVETIDLTECNSKPTQLSYFLYRATNLKRVYGSLDFSVCTAATAWLADAKALEDITIVPNTIGISLDCSLGLKLSKTSIISIINGLSESTSGLTISLSKAAVNKAFETAGDLNDGSTSAEWTTLANTKSNWTITLV